MRTQPNSNPNPNLDPKPNQVLRTPRVTQTPLASRGLALRDSVADASQPLFAEVVAVGGTDAPLAAARTKTEVGPSLF